MVVLSLWCKNNILSYPLSNLTTSLFNKLTISLFKIQFNDHNGLHCYGLAVMRLWASVKIILQHFGKYSSLLSCQELDE